MNDQFAVSKTKLAFYLVLTLAWIQLAAAPARAQTAFVAGESALAWPRIMEGIDDSVLVRIPNSTPRALRNAEDQGRLDGSTKMSPVFLILKSSPDQEQALQTLLDQQQDSRTPNYHRWLTPDEFGAAFGAEESDLQKISDWLTDHGFTVNNVARGRRSVAFSGTAAQVEKAFHTEMHAYLVNGERHISNAYDVSIPKALKSVVAGVDSLNDFKPWPMHTLVRESTRRRIAGTDAQPQYTGLTGNYLTPGDFGVIYHTAPLLSLGYTGAGVTIGIIGLSNINPADVGTFRSIFLPSGYPVNLPAIFNRGQDPNWCSAEELEGDLDVEWAGAVAPSATILYVTSSSLTDAAQYIVDNNLSDILSVSYGGDETQVGAAYSSIWEQASAQGITVFVSSGDQGSAAMSGSCGSPPPLLAIDGYGVNGIASTPWNVAVGGTEFSENLGNSQYWGSNGSNYTSAQMYIPEVVWNESCSNAEIPSGYGIDCDIGPGIWAGGGGVSTLYQQPPWQTGSNVPTTDPISVASSVGGPHRYLPDVSLTAAEHDGYLICTETVPLTGNCWTQDPTTAIPVGGTSAAAPSFAGIQALINQREGLRQGQANYVYYKLASEQQNPSACISTTTGGPASSCIFNDVILGANGVPCQVDTQDCMTGVLTQFWAGAGYDLATGLGSVNALNLFQQWPNAVLPTVTTTNATAITATSASLSGTVNPNGLDTQVWFRYSTDINLISNVTTTSAQDMGAGSNPESFNYPASGLTAGTTYYFQANAQNAAGPSAGTTVGFVTSSNTSTYTLEVIDSGQGTITSSDGRINCNYNSGTCNATYSAGSVVSLSESPAAGWTFSTWGGNCTGAGSCILTMNSNQYAYATFTQNSASYTLTVGESGQGTVTSNVGGINCVNGSGTCSAVFNSGTSVTLSASPATNWTFSGWSGASCAGAGTCTVAMNANQSVTASFSENATSYTLTVAVTGQGSITSADSLINCSPNAGTCSETRPSGTVVNLNAAPAGGWTFSSWSGYCSGSGSCAVPLTANRSVTATFTPSSGGFTISGQVTYNGVGLGDVTLSLTGLVTESTTTVASGNYSFTGLTAGGYNLSASLPGYTFTPAGWGISLYENLTANFAAALANYTLTVSESGQGSVASLDGGISCSNGAGQCSASYTSGTNVTLNASPASGWQFYGWSGACFGTGSCTLTMNSSQAVTAAFSQSSGPLVALPAFTPGIISTVAGNGTAGYLGDGGSPTSAEVNSPHGVAVDSRGTIYVADFDNNRVRAINTGPNPITIAGVTIQPGTIATVAGTGQPGFSGDGGVPSSAQVSYPAAIAVDSLGNIYIADTDNNRIRVINTQSSSITILGVTIGSGTIQTVAGNGTEGFSGDGGAATSAELANPQGVALDANSNLYIADWSNYRVRLVSAATGVITTLAGGGQGCSQQTDGLGDGCPASNSTIVWPVAIAIDGAGNVFVPDNGNSRIRAIYKQGTIPGLASPQAGYIYTIAGAGSGCSQQTDTVGDGCPSVDAGSVIAEGLAVDAGGSLYIADYGNARLRRIDHGTGIITTVAGNGTAGYGGDSGPATNAELSFNSYWYGSVLTIDSNGNLYFGDSSNNRVRLVSAVAAPATFPPTSLGQTSTPQQVALQNDGNAALYITSFAISGGNASDFALPPASNTCPVSPTPLAAGASCTFSLTFTPTQSGSRSSSLLITDNAATITQAISLNGTTPVAPTTTTTGATSITPNSATLTGTVNPNGLDTQVWFIYGTDPTLSSGVFTTPQQDQGAGSGPVIFNINVGSLVASTPYYFQGNASNSAGSTAGSILSFQTPASTFSISGQVTYGGSGLSGVTMALSGGASASVVTNSSGSYAFNSLAGGQTYTLTPSLSGYSFTPSSFSFGSLSSNQTANFTAALTSYSLTVSEVGQGTITSTDGRISCASGVGSCSSSYVSGNAVTLNASAVANWTFLGWTGPCTGRGSCSLTMNSNQTVTATFGSAVATLSPSSLPAFRSQLVGTPSAAQTVTLSNAGSGTLAITSIATSANFGESNNCAGSVAASGSCTINVTFSPSATGPLSGSLTITDNSYGVTGSTQSVALSGTGQDFTLTTASGSSTSATVAPGQPATYTLSATGLGGFSQSVTLACVGAPSEATCTVSPSTLTPGSSATNVTVTVTTTAPSVGAPRSRPLPPVRPLLPGPGGLVMLALALAGVAWAVPGWRQPATSRRRAAFLTLAARLLLILAMAACGGGGGGGGGGIHNAGTPAGTYTLTVTGTAGSGSSALSHSMTLTLTVS